MIRCVDYVRKDTENEVREKRDGVALFAEKFPSDHGMTKEEYEIACTEKLTELFSGAEVVVRVPMNRLREVFSSGRLKNQHETGYNLRRRTRRFLGSTRKEIENKLFYYGDSTAPADRPIYGMLYDGSNMNQGNWFGEVFLVLRDDIRSRSTVFLGDLMATAGVSIPQPLNKPIYLVSSIDFLRLKCIKCISNPGTGLGVRSGYAEVQVHGGVSMVDVKEIRIQKKITIPPDVQMLLDDAGVPVVCL